MQITEVRLKKVDSNGKMKAVASVTFDNSFVVHDIKVIEGTEKTFIAMPSRKTPNGVWTDIANPVNSETRAINEKAIFDKYEEVLKETAETPAEEK